MTNPQEEVMVEPNEKGPVEEWVTLREAERLTGVPVRTLRAWYGSGKVRARMVPGQHGIQREVILEEIQTKAGERTASATAPPIEAVQSPVAPVPENAMLVPLSAWEAMLVQLGHLHEAGQELAEARERAGRAEERYGFEMERRKELERKVAALEAQIAGEQPDTPAAPHWIPLTEPAPEPPPPEEPEEIIPNTLIHQVAGFEMERRKELERKVAALEAQIAGEPPPAPPEPEPASLPEPRSWWRSVRFGRQ